MTASPTQTLAPERDAFHLGRTLELARRGSGRTSPNPLVGAVVVKDGRPLGEGYHWGPGEPHAEAAALAACSEDPAGSTLYVSLEPCAHHGRTPPCAEAILAAGVERVVIASDDPSAKASGRGPEVLRREGVEVQWAGEEVAQEARLLNQPFRKHAITGRPLVVFKSALTLDGRVATRTGDSRWISSEESRARVHRWRADADAVAVGIGTALADDPLLTARVDGEKCPPGSRDASSSTRGRAFRCPAASCAAPTRRSRSSARRPRPFRPRRAGRRRGRGTRRRGRRRGGSGRGRPRRARRPRSPVAVARGRAAPGRRLS